MAAIWNRMSVRCWGDGEAASKKNPKCEKYGAQTG